MNMWIAALAAVIWLKKKCWKGFKIINLTKIKKTPQHVDNPNVKRKHTF